MEINLDIFTEDNNSSSSDVSFVSIDDGNNNFNTGDNDSNYFDNNDNDTGVTSTQSNNSDGFSSDTLPLDFSESGKEGAGDLKHLHKMKVHEKTAQALNISADEYYNYKNLLFFASFDCGDSKT